MKQLFYLLVFFSSFSFCHAQQNTKADGGWIQQYVSLKNTPEAELMIRVGDIDNLGYGWEDGFTPFSGKSTPAHTFPWEINDKDAAGTDHIFVPTKYEYGSGYGFDGYTISTSRPANKPVALSIPLKDIGNMTVKTATLQLFIDDFQAPGMQSKFQVKINGLRFTEAEKIISIIDQQGPVGKLISFPFTEELLQLLKPEASLVIYIDDPTTGNGDGFAIDFAKLLINPAGVLYKGDIKGKIIDLVTQKPIAQATAEVKDYGTVTTDANGEFLLKDIPAGLGIVTGSAAGYSSAQKQVDVIWRETTEEVLLELKRSGKVTYNNKVLQEGDNMIMNNIQFELNSSALLAAGKQELDKLAAFMKQNPSMEILLSGFTSSEGSAAANRELSLKRVRSCKNYLADKGIDEGRISIRGLGPDKPIAANDTEINRAKNRRVEMKITNV